jgi:hypothetical protein
MTYPTAPQTPIAALAVALDSEHLAKIAIDTLELEARRRAFPYPKMIGGLLFDCSGGNFGAVERPEPELLNPLEHTEPSEINADEDSE